MLDFYPLNPTPQKCLQAQKSAEIPTSLKPLQLHIHKRFQRDISSGNLAVYA